MQILSTRASLENLLNTLSKNAVKVTFALTVFKILLSFQDISTPAVPSSLREADTQSSSEK